MLYLFKELFDKEELLSGRFGVEREGLRVDSKGKLALTDHPLVFGDKLLNPYITTDFSESQVELITPALETTKEVYHFLNALYDITVLSIEDEYLWPQSMPCDIPEEELIPIAKYKQTEQGIEARKYRETLFKKYGAKKQLISGIHYNFSFEENLFKKLYEAQKPDIDYKKFKDSLYLKVIRNYFRYGWILVYLIGATPITHSSYRKNCLQHIDAINEEAFSNEGAISYRNGDCGYKNDRDLFPNYNSVERYIQSLEYFVKEGIIQNHKELYTQIRPKAKDHTNLLESLKTSGIAYIELRNIDINPFDKAGISLDDLDFIHLFLIALLLKEETDYAMWKQEAIQNKKRIAKEGRNDMLLTRDGISITRKDWMLEFLYEIKQMNDCLGLDKANIIQDMIEKTLDSSKTYAYQIIERCKQMGYIHAHLDLAQSYKKSAYENRFKFEGYEDLELSTQILIKEAVKRGIQVNLVDRSDHFISLSKNGVTEYVKQATKTSKDSYISMLMMENKTVTKKVLQQHQIMVPEGTELTRDQSANKIALYYEHQAIVVKPKSTNFGIGISIFPEGASKEDIMHALEIGFEHDHTVLIERFAKGKEYRFLVIGNEVAGILHRVPANVEGDGIHTIQELVAIKNRDPLRGKGYKTPLEKIVLDPSSALFLKQQGFDFEATPQKGQVVYLRENSNISTGGDSIDYTDKIPERFKQIAVQAAQAVEAKFCGVDMMLEDYTSEESSYAIIELNFNPAIHIHSFPYKGQERNIAQKVLKVLGFVEV